MNIEESLAAREIAKAQAQGFQKAAATVAAAKLVQSQGFGKTHAEVVAEKMAALIYGETESEWLARFQRNSERIKAEAASRAGVYL